MTDSSEDDKEKSSESKDNPSEEVQSKSESEQRLSFKEAFLKSIREATAKFITFSASHHLAMLSNIRSEPAKPLFKMGSIQIPRLSMRVKIASPKDIFKKLDKTQPIYLRSRIQKLRQFKIDDFKKNKIIHALVKEKLKNDKKSERISRLNSGKLGKNVQYLQIYKNLLEEFNKKYNNPAEGKDAWDNLYDFDTTKDKRIYRQLMLQEAGLRGKRYVAEILQNGIKLATIVGIPGIALAAGGGLAIGGAALGGMLIGSRLLSMASYPILNAVTAYQDNLAGRGYTGAEVLRAGLNNLPLAIAATLLGSTAGSFIQKEVERLISHLGGSEAVKYGLNTFSRVMFMSGSAAAANILSGWLQSRHFSIARHKIENMSDESNNPNIKEAALQALERRERIAKGVVLAATPLAAGIFALRQEIPHLVENTANQMARIEAKNTYNPNAGVVSNNYTTTQNTQPIVQQVPEIPTPNTQPIVQQVPEIPTPNTPVNPVDYSDSSTPNPTSLPAPARQITNLGIARMVTTGPKEWSTAAGLVEESIKFILLESDKKKIIDIFGQINIILDDNQISQIKAGKISEETIRELLRASVVMQQGSGKYPNGSASEIFNIFEQRANAEKRGEVLDGYARLNDAPIDNPYKTVERILVDQQNTIEDQITANLASQESLSNLSNINTESIRMNGSTSSAVVGVDNTLNIDLAGVDLIPVDTLVADTGTNGQFNGFGSIQSLLDFQRYIMASTELSTEQKEKLLQFSKDLAQSKNGYEFAESINQFFGNRKFSLTDLLPVLRKAQDHGFYNPLESDPNRRVKPTITVAEYANSPTGDFQRNWGASGFVKESYIQLRGNNTALSLYDILKESYDKGNFYNDYLDWVPQELIDIYRDQIAYLNQTWNGLPYWAQGSIGLVTVAFLLREGGLSFMPYAFLPKWAKRTKMRRWIRRRYIDQGTKDHLLKTIDQLIDTNGSIKKGQWTIQKREIRNREREYMKTYGGRGAVLINWRPSRFLRARVTAARYMSTKLLEELTELYKTKLERKTDENQQTIEKIERAITFYNQQLDDYGFLSREEMRKIRQILNEDKGYVRQINKLIAKIKRDINNDEDRKLKNIFKKIERFVENLKKGNQYLTPEDFSKLKQTFQKK